MTKQIETGTDGSPELAKGVVPAIDDTAASIEALCEKLADAMTPSYQVEFDPEEADLAGAFTEDALSEEDALNGTDDLAEFSSRLVFIEDGSDIEIPTHVTKANASSLFGKQPGESVKEAIERFSKEYKGE